MFGTGAGGKGFHTVAVGRLIYCMWLVCSRLHNVAVYVMVCHTWQAVCTTRHSHQAWSRALMSKFCPIRTAGVSGACVRIVQYHGCCVKGPGGCTSKSLRCMARGLMQSRQLQSQGQSCQVASKGSQCNTVDQLVLQVGESFGSSADDKNYHPPCNTADACNCALAQLTALQTSVPLHRMALMRVWVTPGPHQPGISIFYGQPTRCGSAVEYAECTRPTYVMYRGMSGSKVPFKTVSVVFSKK